MSFDLYVLLLIQSLRPSIVSFRSGDVVTNSVLYSRYGEMTASVKLCGHEATPWDEVRISLCFLTVVLRFSVATMNVEGAERLGEPLSSWLTHNPAGTTEPLLTYPSS
jgi:hypothetical protein